MSTKKIAGYGFLLALTLVLQALGNFVQIGTVSITLALIPIVAGAVIYGPWCGAFLGLAMGGMTLLAPSTINVFMAHNPWGTIVTCLTKTTVAGFVVGLVYLPFKGKKCHVIGTVLASILMPVLNTGIFVGWALVFFRDLISPSAESVSQSILSYLLLSMVGINFLIEFGINAVLSPAMCSVVRYYDKHYSDLR